MSTSSLLERFRIVADPKPRSSVRRHLTEMPPAVLVSDQTCAITKPWAFDGHLTVGNLGGTHLHVSLVFSGGWAFDGHLMAGI